MTAHPQRGRVGLDEIRTIGDPVLRSATSPVTSFDTDLARLVQRMFAVMAQAGGVGLAANQIGVDASVFVLDCSGTRAAVVNPVLYVPPDAASEVGDEGCLSLPGHHHPTPRAVAAAVDGFAPDGTPLHLTGEGLLARCLQHESDHLAGVVYLDRLPRAQRGRAWRQALAHA